MADTILYVEKKCPVCGSTDLEYDVTTGEYVCRHCGTVIPQIDFSKDTRSFEQRQDESRVRVGAPASLARPDQGLTTTVGGAGDTLKLSPNARNKAKTMKIWQTRINTASERNLRIPLSELNHAIESLQLPNVVREEAAKIYREAASKRLVRGRSMNSVIAGAIYAAARRFNYAITLDEIAETLSTNKKEVGKAYRLLTKALNIRILPPSPKDYIYKYANALGVSNKTLKDAINLLEEADKKGLISGKGPMGVAAAILYIACTLNKEKKTQRDVAKVANITEVTIRNRFKELYDKLVPSK